eukprot:338695-Pyramimonas_sp.AAC.1
MPYEPCRLPIGILWDPYRALEDSIGIRLESDWQSYRVPTGSYKIPSESYWSTSGSPIGSPQGPTGFHRNPIVI